jgi:hypothetical protein
MCTTRQTSEIFANRQTIDWKHCKETGRISLVRINDQWRVVFGRQHGNAYDVQLIDSHQTPKERERCCNEFI